RAGRGGLRRRRRPPRPGRRGRLGAAGDRGRGHRRHQHPGRPGHGARHHPRRPAGRDGQRRGHPAGMAERAHGAVHRRVHPGGGRRRPAPPAEEAVAVTTDTQAPDTQAAGPARRAGVGSLARSLLEDRVALLVILLVVVLVWFLVLSAGGYLVAPYDLDYMASALESMVPLAILGLAQLLVIVSGRGGIDLSVGAMVSLVGMGFGFAHGQWEWSFLPALALALAAGVVLGAVNGLLVAYLRVPALIATLATYYAYSSLA